MYSFMLFCKIDWKSFGKNTYKSEIEIEPKLTF